MNKDLEKLRSLLSDEELETLASAVETIKKSRDGYGTVLIEFSNRWLTRAMPTPSIKTRIRAQDIRL